MDPNDIQSHSNGDSQKSPNQKNGLNPMIKDPSFCIIAGKTYRSDKHSMASVLLLRYWRDDSDDCNYIIIQRE